MAQKTILITGASSGLGAALGQYFHERGYLVFGTSRQGTGHGPFNMVAMDVRDPLSVAAAVAQVITQAGRLDLLINNAGVGIAGPVEFLQSEQVATALETNVLGVFHVCQAAMPHLRQSNGRIINISSIAAEIALPYRAIYSASKAAVDRLTEALRLELAPFGVGCCAVQAGDIHTNIGAHRLMAEVPAASVYAATFQRVASAIDHEVGLGLAPEAVAAAIYQLAESPRLPKFLVVGKPLQKLAVRLKSLLPASWFEAIIRQYAQS